MEHRWYRVDFNAIPQLQHEMGLDPCEGFTNWACYDDTAMYQHIMSTEPYTQSFNLNISTPAGTEQSSGSPALSSPSLCEAVPCQKERVRKPSLCYSLLRYSDFQSQRQAQNRASQRTFRRRQACHIRTLEQELEEIRAKYNNLWKCFEQFKETVCEVEKEDWAGDYLKSCNESLSGGDEEKRIRRQYA